MDRDGEDQRVEVAALRDRLRASVGERGDLNGDPGERGEIEPARIPEIRPVPDQLEAEERRGEDDEPAKRASGRPLGEDDHSSQELPERPGAKGVGLRDVRHKKQEKGSRAAQGPDSEPLS